MEDFMCFIDGKKLFKRIQTTNSQNFQVFGYINAIYVFKYLASISLKSGSREILFVL